MKQKILFLLNGPSRDTALIGTHFEIANLDVDYYWAYNDEFPDRLDRYSAVFLSGSPHGAYDDVEFIHKEHDLVRTVASRGLPILGVCYGSQLLASALCGFGQVFRRSSCDVGYHNLSRSNEARNDAIAKDLFPSFPMFVWHNDEVRSDHQDMVILASSENCPNQIWRYKNERIWGIQGHPEVTKAAAANWFGARRDRLEKDGVDVDELIFRADNASNSKTLLSNFTKVCRTELSSHG
jgi:GMP synthase-like glutamine amidotransferase